MGFKQNIARRSFLRNGGMALGAGLATGSSALRALADTAAEKTVKPDYTLDIAPIDLEIAPGITIKTIAYNSQVPGPILRVREGVPVHIDVTNSSPNEDIVHWHGQEIDSLNDGAMEEGSPMIPPGGHLRYSYTPKPTGTRWYHTHAGAGSDLTRGTYTGQFGFLLVEGGAAPGDYDREIFLAIHHWGPSFVPMVSAMRADSANQPLTTGSDVGYKYATMNQHMLGAGEPIRVKQGQRVLMRLLNASGTENAVLALPGHTFKVIAMDGNAVPNPKAVEVLSLGVAERVDAIVEMNTPGVWVLGSTLADARKMGLGVVVEYAGQSGQPVWKDPAPVAWDYTQFASSTPAPVPDETVTLTFRDIGPLNGSKFDTWTINNKSWPDIDPIHVHAGKRYRLIFRNGSGDQHPVHLHRHTFEVVQIGHAQLSGLRKDVINMMPLQTVAVDFMTNNPGDTLFHCHQQLHMDFGFMTLIKYIS
ncbi:MAG TPA: multicopper oxidase domain-containing protein [Terracidiphilus sp.]|nr:multicopper oxidase domain-containing protein [Terracidiphilus sp.]